MQYKCHKYTAKEISRFIDNELFEEQYQKLSLHLEQCSYCSTLAKQYKTFSSSFQNGVDYNAAQVDLIKIKQKLDLVMKNSSTKLAWNIFGLCNNILSLKVVVSIAAILIFSVFLVQDKLLTSSTPSAIIQYIDTEFASVMILETHKKQHTIIWFSET